MISASRRASKPTERRRRRAAYLRDGIHTAHPARLTVFCNNVFSDGANPNGKMRLPLLIPLRLDVNPLRGDRDHDAFALWVLSSSERAVFSSSLRMSQKGRALLHSGDGRDRTPTCDLWHMKVVVLVMPIEVEENHGIPSRNQS